MNLGGSWHEKLTLLVTHFSLPSLAYPFQGLIKQTQQNEKTSYQCEEDLGSISESAPMRRGWIITRRRGVQWIGGAVDGRHRWSNEQRHSYHPPYFAAFHPPINIHASTPPGPRSRRLFEQTQKFCQNKQCSSNSAESFERTTVLFERSRIV